MLPDFSREHNTHRKRSSHGNASRTSRVKFCHDSPGIAFRDLSLSNAVLSHHCRNDAYGTFHTRN